MLDLPSCELTILTWVKDAITGGYAVDLLALLNQPLYINYSKEDIIQAVDNLKKRELIKVKTIFGKEPDIGFIIYDVTAKGRSLI